MHLYIATKGIKKEIDDFITQLQGKYLPFKWRPNKDAPMKDVSVQLSVRPIQLWEIGYPKEHHDIVCTTILGQGYQGLMGNDGEKAVVHKWINKFIWAFRKLLHLDPIPPWKEDMQMPIGRQHLVVLGLGTKEDYILPEGYEGL